MCVSKSMCLFQGGPIPENIQVFKAKLEGALSNLIERNPHGRDWNSRVFNIPSLIFSDSARKF